MIGFIHGAFGAQNNINVNFILLGGVDCVRRDSTMFRRRI